LKDIVLGEATPVRELARRVGQPIRRIVEVGFSELGLLLTIQDDLAFNQASVIVAEFGYRARRQDS
jgi:putative addiction module component (TIGR02574 family)